MLKEAGSQALAGIKILDFSRVLAAPLTSMVLGDLGAEIWKIERIGTGDDTRKWIPPTVNEQSCYFLSMNRNKKSIALDLRSKEGQDLARRLAAKSDVVLENFKTGNMAKFGLDYESLRKINEKIIYCSITGYGSKGPYAGDPGYDVIAAAVGGFMKATGPIGGEPVKAAVAVTDMLTGLYAHGAILASLWNREKTGYGQKIECNLFSTQLSAMMNLGSNYLNVGTEPKPLGSQHESIVPYQAFETSDGRHYVIGAGNDRAFRVLCEKIQLGGLSENPKFKTNKDRVENREELIGILAKKFKQHPLSYWTSQLRSNQFPSGPVNSLSEAFAHPQAEFSGIVKKIEHPSYGQVKVVGPPVSYSTIENEIRTPPPLLGEHTVEVLQKELGLETRVLEDLKKRQIIDFPGES
ncbi:hypothetical protein FO519_004603 [Halicephalobus sp. NKZ332]|nr:hypothetical protein FO519_004603 [Halicephalobus sp. NKZ332]